MHSILESLALIDDGQCKKALNKMNKKKINPFGKKAFPLYKQLKCINQNQYYLDESNEALINQSYWEHSDDSINGKKKAQL